MKIKHNKILGLSVLVLLSGFTIYQSINSYTGYNKALATDKVKAEMEPREKASMQVYGLPIDDLKFNKSDKLKPILYDETTAKELDTTAEPVFKDNKPMNLSAVNSFKYIKKGHIRITDQFENSKQNKRYNETADGYFTAKPFAVHLNTHDNNVFNINDVKSPFASLRVRNMSQGSKHGNEIVIDHGWKVTKHDTDEKTAVLRDLQHAVINNNPRVKKHNLLTNKCKLTRFQIYENVDWSTKKIKSIKLSYTLTDTNFAKETRTIEIDHIQTR